MSHKCTGNCRRKQIPSQRSSCPSCSSRKGLPEKITVVGVTRLVAKHFHDRATPGHKLYRKEVTEARIKRVLEHWTAKGICKDSSGRYSNTYWGFVKGQSGKDHLMRVAVSLDDQTLVTGYYDDGALGRCEGWPTETKDWFEKRCLEWEVR